MKINVLSKVKFIELLSSQNINDSNVENYNQFYISINNSNAQPYFKENHSNVLNLFFDDVTQNYKQHEIVDYEKRTIRTSRNLKAITDEDAITILEFLEQNKDCPSLIVHCSAGISRSGAVGLFINDYMRQSYFDFMKINPQVKPNPLVLELLRKHGN